MLPAVVICCCSSNHSSLKYARNYLDHQVFLCTGVMSIFAMGEGALRVALLHEESVCCFLDKSQVTGTHSG